MLVLSRSAEQEIRIGQQIRIRVLRVSGSTVKLGIEAPPETPIVRGELPDRSPRRRRRMWDSTLTGGRTREVQQGSATRMGAP